MIDKTFLQLMKQEDEILQETFTEWEAELNILIDAWRLVLTDAYFERVTDIVVMSLGHKTQVEKALFLVTTSLMRRHYAQALTQLRYAVENMSVSVAILYSPQTFKDIHESYDDQENIDSDKYDKEVKSAAKKILDKEDPAFSKILKSKKDVLNNTGPHQSRLFTDRNITLTPGNKRVVSSMFDKPEEMTTIAILHMSTTLIFDYSNSIVTYCKKDGHPLVKVSIFNEMEKLKKKFIALQPKHSAIREKYTKNI